MFFLGIIVWQPLGVGFPRAQAPFGATASQKSMKLLFVGQEEACVLLEMEGAEKNKSRKTSPERTGGAVLPFTHTNGEMNTSKAECSWTNPRRSVVMASCHTSISVGFYWLYYLRETYFQLQVLCSKILECAEKKYIWSNAISELWCHSCIVSCILYLPFSLWSYALLKSRLYLF